MGANGIGKSTLLNCINYAITGRINFTSKKLKSIDSLDKGNNYYLEYFDGRICEADKDYASIQVTFSLGNTLIEVSRRFFPDNGILEYKLDNVIQNTDNYESDIIRISNLTSYSQFVFLQLKVLTFDESRDCLFWNPSILTPTIFLCLGESVDDADHADNLARQIQKVNSRIRNVQWEITKQSARLTTLIEEKTQVVGGQYRYSKEDEANAQNEYENILKSLEEKESSYQGLVTEQQQIYAKITEKTIEKVGLKNNYAELYEKLYSGVGHFLKHPIIMALTTEGCPICHSFHKEIPERIADSIDKNICPLCGESIFESQDEQSDIIAKLADLDKAIASVEHDLEELVKRQETIKNRIKNLKVEIEKTITQKEAIENKGLM